MQNHHYAECGQGSWWGYKEEGVDVSEAKSGEKELEWSDAKPCFTSLFSENCIIYSN